jgi:L-ascorbate metabolism protein UlaG (beta-lactamase superfamily)
MKPWINRITAIAGTVVIALSIGACAYLHPTLGQLPDGARQARIEASPNYRDGQFQNQIDTPMRTNAFTLPFAWIRGWFEPRDRPRPTTALPTTRTDLRQLPRDQDTVVWLGHSSYFVQLGGRRVLIDPVFGTSAAPLPGMVRAFDGTSIHSAADMPDVDYILISHDHYDHLDHASMREMQPKTRRIVAGLGIGAHFEHWGYPVEKLQEADWNTVLEFDPGLKIHVLPARHYSGRFFKRNQSLWVSFALETPQRKLYFSGDSGFGPHFEEIGRRLGPFDLAALDSGQYNPRWGNIHMNPEEASRAAELLGTRALLTAHAGRFTLARHAWDEPFRFAEAAASSKPYRLLTPRIGEPVRLADRQQRFERWWIGIE